MRTLWMILGCLIAVAGCTQQTATVPSQQAAQSVHEPTETIVKLESAQPVVQASYEETNDVSAGPRVVVTTRHIDLMATPPGQAILDQLWDEEVADDETPRTRVLDAKAVLKLLAAVDSQGLARHTASPEVAIASGKTGDYVGGGGWKITPTIQPDGSVNLAISIFSLNQPPTAPPDSGSQMKAAALIRAGETLVIEGETYQTLVTEITRTPYLSDLPIIGGNFNSKKSTLDPHQSLYLVTVESVNDE